MPFFEPFDLDRVKEMKFVCAMRIAGESWIAKRGCGKGPRWRIAARRIVCTPITNLTKAAVPQQIAFGNHTT
jgi:hypothetical protein